MVFTLFAGCGNSTPEEEPTEIETTQAAEQVAVLDVISQTWMGDTVTYTVGKEITLDEFGRISIFEDRYDLIKCTYNSDGALEEVNFTYKNKDNKTGFEKWTYENKIPTGCTYEPNSYRSSRVGVYEVKTDDAGRIIEIIENNTLTDSEDGSTSTQTIKNEYTYDADGKIISNNYYSDGELDHTTNITYDENGNILVYSNIGADSGSEYLRFEFTYKMVDKGTYNVEGQNPNTTYSNWDHLLNHIL